MNNQTINYIFNITGNANDVINNIKQNANALNENLSQTLNVFGGINGAFVGFQGVVSTIQSVNDAIGGITQAGANAELQLMNLKTLFGGNAEAAEAMYDRISEYGKVTPYDKAGLIEAQRTMMSFGIEGNPAHTGEVFTDNANYIRTLNRSNVNIGQKIVKFYRDNLRSKYETTSKTKYLHVAIKQVICVVNKGNGEFEISEIKNPKE